MANRVTITVLNETEIVMEERDGKRGELLEVSYNYFAVSKMTGDVFYLGVAVDIYRGGKVVRHSGVWRADQALTFIIAPVSLSKPKSGWRRRRQPDQR